MLPARHHADPSSHDRDPSTVRDVTAVLEKLLEGTAACRDATAGEREGVRAGARSLLMDRRPLTATRWCRHRQNFQKALA